MWKSIHINPLKQRINRAAILEYAFHSTQSADEPVRGFSVIFCATGNILENVLRGDWLCERVEQNGVYFMVRLSTEDDGEPVRGVSPTSFCSY